MIECFLFYSSDPMFSRAKCASPGSEFKPNLILSFPCARHDPHFSLHGPRQGRVQPRTLLPINQELVIELLITHTFPPTTQALLLYKGK